MGPIILVGLKKILYLFRDFRINGLKIKNEHKQQSNIKSYKLIENLITIK